MGISLIDYFVTFEELNRRKPLSAGTRSMYYAILAAFNREGFPPELVIPIRDLASKSGLKSIATAQTCKNVLQEMGLIKCETKKGTTSITLLSDLAVANKAERALRRERILSRATPNAERTLTERGANADRTATERQPNAERTPGRVLPMSIMRENNNKRAEERIPPGRRGREEVEEIDWRKFTGAAV